MKLSIPTLLIGLVPVCAAFAAGTEPSTSRLSITITGIRSDSGQIGCQLFNSSKGFPDDTSKAFQKHWCKIENGSSTCKFDSMPAGTYAAACFHDENRNGKIDRGVLGIPKEGAAISNYVKLKGPPRFKKARFEFSGEPTVLLFRLTYKN